MLDDRLSLETFTAVTILNGITNLIPVPLVNAAFVRFRIWALPDGNEKKVYDGEIIAVLLNIPHISTTKKVATNTLPYDSASGGALKLSPDKPLPGNEEESAALPLDFEFATYGFMPMVSALDLDVPHPYYDATDVAANLGLTNARNYTGTVAASTQVAVGVSEPIFNREHVTFSRNSVEFLLSHLRDIRLPNNQLPEVATIENRIYNFGTAQPNNPNINPPTGLQTPEIIDEDITITTNGTLWVNGNDRIAFTNNEDNNFNQLQSEFEVFIKTDHCDDNQTLIQVTDRGKFIIGDWTGGVQNKAKVYVQEDGIIEVGQRGEIVLDNRSKLIIENGGIINIQNRGMIQSKWNTDIIVKEGGVLKVESGGILRPQHNGKVIVEEGGQLILEAGAQVQLWDEANGEATIHIKNGGELVINGAFDFDGSGFFQFSSGNILTLNAPFVLQGKGNGHRFMQLNSDAELLIDRHFIELNHG